jgi:hypothetical protein
MVYKLMDYDYLESRSHQKSSSLTLITGVSVFVSFVSSHVIIIFCLFEFVELL